MAEVHMDEFTTAAGVEFGDVWPIQRNVAGAWKDYQVRNANMFGQDIATVTRTYLIQDLVAAPQQFVVAVPSGFVYVPWDTYAIYTPDNVTDGTNTKLTGHVSFESGGNNASCGIFTFNDTVQGSALRGNVGDVLVAGFQSWYYFISTPTTANGTITVFSQYFLSSV